MRRAMLDTNQTARSFGHSREPTDRLSQLMPNVRH
jgi:hypothetical protein